MAVLLVVVAGPAATAIGACPGLVGEGPQGDQRGKMESFALRHFPDRHTQPRHDQVLLGS